MFDLNRDGTVDAIDHRHWVFELKGSGYGDSNLDRVFDSSDLVLVFQLGQYERADPSDASWMGGDWNGDGSSNSSDFVDAFRSTNTLCYEQGRCNSPLALISVPEPSRQMMLLCGLLVVTRRRTK